MNLEGLQAICNSFPGVTEDIKWGDHLCFCVGGKIFIITSPAETPVTASFKVHPDKLNELVEREGFKPAPYLAKHCWVWVDDIGRLKSREWKELLESAYQLVKSKLPAGKKNNFKKTTVMQSKATTVDQYVEELPADRQKAIQQLRKVIKKNLSKGFQECMNYGMIGYVVPHSKYPNGYHCNPKDPLPFMNVASQKNSINIYHMGIYGDPKLLKWFQDAHAKASPKKLDMGKSCIRYKNPDDIPVQLIGELASKLSMEKWIEMYESTMAKGRKKK